MPDLCVSLQQRTHRIRCRKLSNLLSTPIHVALARSKEPPQQLRFPQTNPHRGLKVDSIPIAAASPANASGFIQKRPNRKCPGQRFRPCPKSHAPGHFRLSHSVSRDVLDRRQIRLQTTMRLPDRIALVRSRPTSGWRVNPGPVCFLTEYIKLDQDMPLQLLMAKRTCSRIFSNDGT